MRVVEKWTHYHLPDTKHIHQGAHCVDCPPIFYTQKEILAIDPDTGEIVTADDMEQYDA